MFSISSCTLSVLWNGEALPTFAPSRGLRQGDPLYPYLFILAMEKLSYLIQHAVNRGRSTTDNIILSQEALNTMKKMKGKKGAMAVKLDLQKVFDNLDWSFLKTTLLSFGFPQRLVELIMFSISSCTLSVLWNGEALPPFAPSRGLR